MKLFVVDENKQARGMLVYNKLTEDTSYTYVEPAEKYLGNKKLPIRNMLRLFSMDYCVGVSVVEKNTFIQLCKNDKLTVFIEDKDKNLNGTLPYASTRGTVLVYHDYWLWLTKFKT